MEQRPVQQFHRVGGGFRQIIPKTLDKLLIQLKSQIVFFCLSKTLHAGENHFLVPWLPELPDTDQLLQPGNVLANGRVLQLIPDVGQTTGNLQLPFAFYPSLKFRTAFQIEEVQKSLLTQSKFRIRRVPVRPDAALLVQLQPIPSLKNNNIPAQTAADLEQSLTQIFPAGVLAAGSPEERNQFIAAGVFLHTEIVEDPFCFSVGKAD